MKICLINPPKTIHEKSDTSSIAGKPSLGLPLGLLYVAGSLEKAGHDVIILDCLIGNEVVIQKKENGVMYYGLPEEIILSKIKEINPDVVGITSQFSAQARNAENTAKIIKQANPNVSIILGGSHITIKGYETLKNNLSVDIAVIGEGEYTAVEIVDALENKKDLLGVKGIIFRNEQNQIIQNPRREHITKLDDLPIPAYHLINMEEYLSLHEKGIFSRNPDEKRAVSLITSRGCPFNCVFCSIHIHMGKSFRAHSPEYVINHIKQLVDKYNVKQIHFEDDNFTFDQERCEKIIDGMIENNFGLTWDTPNGVRADRLNRTLLQKMKKSGLTNLTIGVESGDQEILTNVVGKALDLKKVEEVVKLCYEEKISLGAFFVVGFPGEKIENMHNTRKFACKLVRKYGLRNPGGAMVATPLYGTRLYNQCKENNYFVKDVLPETLSIATQRGGKGLIKTPDFTPEDIQKFNREFIRSCYVNMLAFYAKHPISFSKYAGNIVRRTIKNKFMAAD